MLMQQGQGEPTAAESGRGKQPKYPGVQPDELPAAKADIEFSLAARPPACVEAAD